MKNGENNPLKIKLGEENQTKEDEIITVWIKGEKFLVTPTEALSVMNQISGVLLAYGYSGGYRQGQKKYLEGIRDPESEVIRS